MKAEGRECVGVKKGGQMEYMNKCHHQTFLCTNQDILFLTRLISDTILAVLTVAYTWVTI